MHSSPLFERTEQRCYCLMNEVGSEKDVATICKTFQFKICCLDMAIHFAIVLHEGHCKLHFNSFMHFMFFWLYIKQSL